MIVFICTSLALSCILCASRSNAGLQTFPSPACGKNCESIFLPDKQLLVGVALIDENKCIALNHPFAQFILNQTAEGIKAPAQDQMLNSYIL